MIPSHLRHQDPELDGLARQSLTDFIREKGGEVLNRSADLLDAQFGISFDSEALVSPIVAVFPDPFTSLLVAKTLSLSEPGDTEIRVVLPPSSQVEPLNFLIHSSNKPQDCTLHTCKDLRDILSPDTPRELLQEFLARVTQQVREEGIPFGVNFHEAVAHNAGILAGAVVARYYQRIDRGEPCDITEIVDLFASDATYRRGGEAIVGKEAIKEFFTSTRSLIGSHELRCMTVAGLKVVVEGEFLGSSQCSGENRQLSFVDTWRFNTKGMVAQRETYLQMGYRDTI